MNPTIEVIAKKVNEVVRQGSHVLAGAGGPSDVVAIIRKYHVWYATCLGLVEANMPSRVTELVSKNSEVDLSESVICASPNAADATLRLAAQKLRGNLAQISGIVASVPAYLEARLHNLELAVASAYVTEQIGEAEILLRAGHVRAAGAIAGVLLERHLRLLCDQHSPPIPYAVDKATIAKLNDPLRDAGVYNISQWRNVQRMADIRNQCAHAGIVDPRTEDVRDLIAEVRKFVVQFLL